MVHIDVEKTVIFFYVKSISKNRIVNRSNE